MVVVLGITVAGYYKIQPLPLQTLPFAQPEFSFSSFHVFIKYETRIRM